MAAIPPLHALENVMALIDEGVLVRDISHDNEPGWVMKMPFLVRVLGEAQATIDKARNERVGGA